METVNVRLLMQSAATGSFLFLSSAPLLAGHIFPEEPRRPHIAAGCMPNWGFNQTCWQRFPSVPACEVASGCDMNIPPVSQDDEHSGQLYTPQSGLIIPDQSLHSRPTSILPPSANGSRLLVPSPSGSGSQLILPESVTPPDSGASDSRNEAGPQAPSTTVPEPAGLAPPVRTLQATPRAPLALPPLPSPPVSNPQPQGQEQSGFVPDRLIFGPNGQIIAVHTAAGVTAPTFRSASQPRYGRRAETMPAPAAGQQATIFFGSPDPVGVPLHLPNGANASSMTTIPSSRYGRPSPTFAAPLLQPHRLP